jgi:uncharacterized iron-regulated protein
MIVLRGLGIVVLSLVLAQSCTAGELTFSAAAGKRLTLAELVPRLREARFILIGEEHSNYRHHAVQISILAALLDAGLPLAAGLEVFPVAATPELGRWISGELDSAPFYELFDVAWNLENWSAYRDLLFFLRDRRIPSAGINAEDALIRRVAREGYAALSAAERGNLPPGGCVVDRRYRTVLERVVGGGTGAGHENRFENFCEAQSLRDAIMARELAGVAKKRPEHIVIGLTGLYHAWKPAVPARLEQLGLGPVVVILPAEGPSLTMEDLAPEADYLWTWRD